MEKRREERRAESLSERGKKGGKMGLNSRRNERKKAEAPNIGCMEKGLPHRGKQEKRPMLLVKVVILNSKLKYLVILLLSNFLKEHYYV